MSNVVFFAVSQNPVSSFNIIELFDRGGWGMWPILILSILAVIFAVVGLTVTSRRYILGRHNALVQVFDLLKTRSYSQIVVRANDTSACFSSVVYKTISFVRDSTEEASLSEIREIAAAEGSRQINGVLRKISWLSDIGAIAPMFGLLGTVTGMIQTFWELSAGNFEGVRQMQMSEGVAQALLTTAFGLIVGIPSLLVYAYLRGRANKMIADLESHTVQMLARLSLTMGKSNVSEKEVDVFLDERNTEIS